MATDMEFGLLGPVMVRRGGAVVQVPPGKQRAVLAALLLSAGQPVSSDELTEVLWGTSPPPSARVTMQNYVMRLRKTLGGAGSRIITQPRGYLFQVSTGELDVSRFTVCLEAAHAAARNGSWHAAEAQARAGLSLWRGEPLADVDSWLLATRDVPRLEEMRLQATEIRIDADMRLGRNAQVIPELRQLTRSHALREHLHALLMLALYRDGRQAEALAAYSRAREVLVEELGADPGTELRDLHRRILAADPALAASNTPKPASRLEGGKAPVIPRELPAGVGHFTGRADELARLTALLEQPGDGPPTVLISAISGTAGVGKTALAVHLAHRVAVGFPDGQLFVDLRGYDPGQPVTAADALAGFLRALGVPGRDVPADEAERAARYRSLLAGRRMLVVLDNAAAVEQVRPLLPGTPSCAVVVTSRDSLPGLVARDGAVRLDLDLLPLPDAVGLLTTLIGGRAEADPEAAAALATACCRLPLALRVACEVAVARPEAPLARLCAELGDQQRRLDLLEAGADTRTAVRAVFSWSYRHLDADAARAFRLLGLHPGPGLDAYTAAALTGAALEAAQDLLARLAHAHLIQPDAAGGYGMHDLLRAYARELATSQDTDTERQAALTRLFGFYLSVAAAAMDILYPAERDRRPRVDPPSGPAPRLDSARDARGWLDRERTALVATAAQTAEHSWPPHAARLAPTLFRYLDAGGYHDEAAAVCGHALAAARLMGDRAAEAAALLCLGGASWRLDRYDDAATHLAAALDLFREVGDRRGEARALSNLGVVESCHGRSESAAGYHRQALAIFRSVADRLGEALALDSVGGLLCGAGDHHQAAEHQRAALRIYRQLGERQGEAGALLNLGVTQWQAGSYRDAAGHMEQALAVYRQIGDRLGQGRALYNVGVVEWWRGNYARAAQWQRAAVAVFREVGDEAEEARALVAYGEALSAAGDGYPVPLVPDDGETLAAGVEEPVVGDVVGEPEDVLGDGMGVVGPGLGAKAGVVGNGKGTRPGRQEGDTDGVPAADGPAAGEPAAGEPAVISAPEDAGAAGV